MKRKHLNYIVTPAIALSLIMLSACNSNSNKSSSSPVPTTSAETPVATKDNAPADPFGKYDPPITISTVKIYDTTDKFYNGETADHSLWSDGELKDLGIQVKLNWSVQGTEAGGPGEQKLNVTVASNDLPDLMPVNAKQLQLMQESGQLEDLTDVIKKYESPKLKKMLEVNGGQALQIATFGGKVMALPVPQQAGDTSPMIWIRKDWLDKLGLQPPKTLDDVLKIADAFTNKDPDGNSKKDSYGLGLTKDLYNTGLHDLEGLFEAYHAYPLLWVKDASGKLSYGGIQPQAKATLATLQKMFKAGDIDPEFGVKDLNKENELVVSGKIGMFYGQHWDAFFPLPDAYKQNPKADWEPYPIVSADSNPVIPSMALSANLLGLNSFYVIKKGYPHPEAVVKLANYTLEKFYGFDTGKSDLNFLNYIGPDGKIDSQYQRQHLAAVLIQSPTQNMDIFNGVKAAYGGDQSGLKDGNVKSNFDLSKKFEEAQKAGQVDASSYGNWKWINPTQSSFTVLSSSTYTQRTTDQFWGVMTPTMLQKKSTLDKLQLETYTKILLGSASVDTFDQFVLDWKKLGGDAITQEVNDWAAKNNH